ncbi:MAG: DUF2723 domain-containing protein [candidate division KSB1 bacterium]|nr:DUF2723 domain-containing protein [candidate division KSB1 bacterium]MDZ7273412.1 DUF2723 domain-containing protein [candidate division KSB1 bacterium]MDZ7286995.1 DUF2723 domain-containing protein [candidate division KSB1 bacterium]MDZ7299652.1 DUF2723 domain-containing protein [candidate division KSB1 bacterium]MDZ7309309.1 DUF2723 domain-containing protein [candidate division KSB1 bacterium]
MQNLSAPLTRSSFTTPGALLAAALSCATYWRTLAPTVSFGNAGEFIACAYILGVPHPPGAPLYLLLGRLFTLLPLGGEIAWRVNLISALASAVTVLLTYLIILRLLRRCLPATSSGQQVVAALLGSLALAFSDSFWFNAVSADVHALSLCLTALVIWLALRWAEAPATLPALRHLVLALYLIALAVGVHLLNVLTIPVVLLLMYFETRPWHWHKWFALLLLLGLALCFLLPGSLQGLPLPAPLAKLGGVPALVCGLLMVLVAAGRREFPMARLAGAALFLIVLGYSTYLTVFIRSNLDPAIDGNDPQNWTQLASYFSREQDGGEDLFSRLLVRKAPLWDYQIKARYLRYLGWQFFGRSGEAAQQRGTLLWQGLGGLPFLLGVIGMFYHFRRHPQDASLVALLFVMTGLALVIYLNQTPGQPREHDYAYVGSYLAFAIWIGMGAQMLFEKAAAAPYRLTVIQLGLASLLVLAVPVNLLQHNFHRRNRQGNYTAADYARNLLSTCAPDAILFTNGDHDTFPLWYMQQVERFRRDVSVVNLGLLHAPWYVRQLQTRPPRVPLPRRAGEPDSLRLRPWPEPRMIHLPITNAAAWRDFTTAGDSARPPYAMTILVNPTHQGRFLRPQDRLIIDIISANQFQRPVYFGGDVPNENLAGLQPHLRNEGLARRLLPVPGHTEAPELLATNLLTVYRYRNLANPKVYLDDLERGVAEHYRSHFLTLVQHALHRGAREQARALLQRFEQILPETKFPFPSFAAALELTRCYWQAGDTMQVRARLEQAARQRRLRPEQGVEIAKFYWHLLQDGPRAQEVLTRILARLPQYQPARELQAEIASHR